MRALIAHRRLVTATDGVQQYELAIGSRNFACFNGFNVEGAFNKQNDPEVIHMVTGTEGRFSNRTEDWLETNAKRNQFAHGKTLGPWECVGIGWIYNGAQASSQGPMHGRSVPPQAKAYDFVVGNALRREGFMGRYYDAWNGAYVQSIRQLTPMEVYLSRVFSQFEIEDRQQVPNGIQQASPFAAAVQWNQSSAGCLYQFVGSERPSGQAVAFLQTFRNVSEVQYSGWTGTNQMKYNLIVNAYNRINRAGNSTESIYPLMDHLVNYGTDNAITCYSNAGVMLHGMKYGFWTLSEFFHNTASMVVEGRYNKGAQSNNLKGKYEVACRVANVSVDQGARMLFDTIKNATTQQPLDVSVMVTYENILRHSAARTLDRLTTQVMEGIQSVARSDQTATVTRIVEVMRAHGDARRPPEPVAPPAPAPRAALTAEMLTQGAAQSATPRNTTAGAAIGFTQWTSTAVH